MDFLKNILYLVFPRICLGCKNPITRKNAAFAFCELCLPKITPVAEFLCSQCGRRYGETGRPCHFSAIPVFAGFLYTDEPIRNAIHALKYEGVEHAATSLVDLMWKSMHTQTLFKNSNTGLTLFLLPIPLTEDRIRTRGFNQSLLLGESLVTHLHKNNYTVSLVPDFLKRIKNTPSQTSFPSHAERRKNIAGAFEITKKYMVPKNALVLLIDDVTTSGATIEEAARILKKAGVPHIAGLVIAKA